MKIRQISLFLAFFIAFLFLLTLNISLGSVSIPFKKVWEIVFFHETTSTSGSIIWQIRLPRILFASISGIYLSISGLLLQVFFRNPIVGPYVLGISSGATLMVALVMLAGIGINISLVCPFLLSVSAFVGALLVMLILVLLSSRVKSIETLLIIGLMMGYLCYAVTSILVVFAQKEKVKGFFLWQMGSFSGITWKEFSIVSFLGIAIFIGLFFLKKPLNAFLLGEEYAKTMGVNIKAFRILIITISSALSGIVTAFSGPVAFIGLAIPHMARLSFGTSDNGILIPASAIIGADVIMLCDFFARNLFSPIELPISAITAIFGAPIVIGLLLKKRMII